MEQPIGGRKGHEGRAIPGAGRLAAQGHVQRVSPKCSDVVPDPFEDQDLIAQCIVAAASVLRAGDLAQLEEAQHPDTVVAADSDDAVARERLPLVGWQIDAARRISPTIDPHEYRMRAGFPRSPDVELEAVLGHWHRLR